MDEFREIERGHYNALVNDGGRPCYPIALLQDVSENPKEYRTMLRPWQESPDTSWPSWEVFGRQLQRWEDFRAWQLVNRDIYDPDNAYVAFVEKWKRMRVAEGDKGDSEELAALEADPLHLMSLWKDGERERKRDYPHLWWVEKPRPTGEGKGDTKELATRDADHYFRVYVEQVKRRLAQHGFTRTFQLEADPKRQDKLTTWIEYLNYEYSWYDRYARSVKRLQPQHDEDWEKLVDSGALRPSETEEYLLTDESAFQRHSEWSVARRALKSAKEAANAALAETEKAKHGRSSLSTEERKRRLAAALSRVNTAKESWEVTKRRADLIREFIVGIRDYRVAKDDVYRQGVLLQWILEQVPLVEAELSEVNELESEPSLASASSLCVAQQASLPRPAKDTSRKTRSGRIAKNAAQTRRGNRFRHSEPTRAEALPLHRRRGPSKPDVLGDIGHNTRTAPQPRKRQRKTYEKERASRRLAGDLPEFAGLPVRGEAPPLYEPSLQQASDADKTSSSVPRSSRLSKKPTVIKGAKPQGISKSRQDEARARRIRPSNQPSEYRSLGPETTS